MDGTGELFAPLIAALGGALHVATVRYPARQALDYDSLAALALRDLPDEDFILLGESFSGPIAVALAAARPRGLRGLVLCSSFVRNPRPALAPLGALARCLPVKAAPAWLRHHYLLGRHATPPLRAALAAALTQVDGAVLRARLRAVLEVDVSDALRAVAAPVLYLQGAEDRLVPPSAAGVIAALQPATRIAVLAAPHCLLQAAPRAAAEVLTTFALDVTSAPPR